MANAENGNLALISYNNYCEFCKDHDIKAIDKVDFYEHVIYYFIDSQLHCDNIEQTREGVIRVNDEVNVYFSFTNNKYYIGFDTKTVDELDEIFESQQEDNEEELITSQYQ